MQASSNNPIRLCVCASEELKLIGSTDGSFPDMGHHIEKEMNGMWLHPIKLLDGFWLRLEDHSTDGKVNTWIRANKFVNFPYGNLFLYDQDLGHTSIRIERFQFAPDGINGCVAIYKLFNRSAEQKDISVELLARTDLRPTWLSEKQEIYDGDSDSAEFIKADNLFLAKDSANPWYAAVGSDTIPESTRIGQFFASEITSGAGVSVSMTFSFLLEPWETKEVVFYFAGSYKSCEECIDQYHALHKHQELLDTKKRRYEEIRSMSELITNDSRFNEVYEWVKVNTDWLVLNVADMGRGVTAGLPEYPYWFGCDGCYTVLGLLATGRFDVAKQTLRILRQASEKHNKNGRIIHEIVSNDVVSNPGNTQETAQFINTVWEYFEWTGDTAFIEECFPYIQKGIEWLDEMDSDNDGFPSGYGIIEVQGMDMELIDTAVYTAVAYDVFGKIHVLMNDLDAAKKYRLKSAKIKDAIMEFFWLPEKGLFADTVTTSEAVKERLSSTMYNGGPDSEPYRAYLESEISKKESNGQCQTESGWLLDASWVIATPMEMGIAPEEYAQIALTNLHTNRFLGPYGAYLSGLGIDFRAMTISSNVYAAAQARYGNADRALDILMRMFSTFGMATPGSISEMSPDYGCFAQGWTIYCATTIVKYFFGISPDVPNRVIYFSPCMPSAWDTAAIKNVSVGDGSLSISFKRVDGIDTFKVENNTGLEIIIEEKHFPMSFAITG
ncbi:MAG: hypothetical protein FWE11_06885 [Defluviitaleaceae bacterium]|nr:hypothetical protein [Defluviitaleaceae bacterium]